MKLAYILLPTCVRLLFNFNSDSNNFIFLYSVCELNPRAPVAAQTYRITPSSSLRWRLVAYIHAYHNVCFSSHVIVSILLSDIDI